MSTQAAYQATSADSPLSINEELYLSIGDPDGKRRKVAEFVIPIRSGRAWDVPAGHVCRLSTVDGPQVADLNIWNRHDPRERLWASRTRQLQAAHVTTLDRLWSTLPRLRPLVTIVHDTLGGREPDADGARVHDLLGTRCDPYVNKMLTGEEFDFHCHSNLVRAVHPFHLTEYDVHDVLNVFQATGLNEDDQYFMKASPARPGDYFEMFAEIDLLMALSTCPQGDLSLPQWGPDAGDPLDTCHPIKVEVFEVDQSLLAGWSGPAVADYAGMHGATPGDWARESS